MKNDRYRHVQIGPVSDDIESKSATLSLFFQSKCEILGSIRILNEVSVSFQDSITKSDPPIVIAIHKRVLSLVSRVPSSPPRACFG